LYEASQQQVILPVLRNLLTPLWATTSCISTAALSLHWTHLHCVHFCSEAIFERQSKWHSFPELCNQF
jgi:hypothetical protein